MKHRPHYHPFILLLAVLSLVVPVSPGIAKTYYRGKCYKNYKSSYKKSYRYNRSSWKRGSCCCCCCKSKKSKPEEKSDLEDASASEDELSTMPIPVGLQPGEQESTTDKGSTTPTPRMTITPEPVEVPKPRQASGLKTETTKEAPKPGKVLEELKVEPVQGPEPKKVPELKMEDSKPSEAPKPKKVG